MPLFLTEHQYFSSEAEYLSKLTNCMNTAIHVKSQCLKLKRPCFMRFKFPVAVSVRLCVLLSSIQLVT